jgi:hypothetical protein
MTDNEFLMVAESYALSGKLPLELVNYLSNHTDPSMLMINGLREVEHVFCEAVGEDLSLAVMLTQKWVMLAHQASAALKPHKYLSARFWVYLRDLSRLASDLDLTEDACEALRQWKQHNIDKIPEEQVIAAVDTILSGYDLDLIDFFILLNKKGGFND